MSDTPETTQPDYETEDERVREAGSDPPAQDEAPGGDEAGPEPDADPANAAPAHPAVAPAPEEPDYKDQWLRAVAELDNVRKRARRDAGLAETRGASRLARELLPALDNLERALAAAEAQPENADHHLTDGIRLVQQDLLVALGRAGIVQDSPLGEAFDPHVHEAVAQAPVADARTGTIVEVYSPGYRLGDDVLRAAKVVVAA